MENARFFIAPTMNFGLGVVSEDAKLGHQLCEYGFQGQGYCDSNCIGYP